MDGRTMCPMILYGMKGHTYESATADDKVF